MMHGFTRWAAKGFGGHFGEVPPGVVAPVEKPVTVAGQQGVALAWAGESDIPVVLLHGLSNSPWIWARVGHLLAPEWSVVAPPLRGHGTDDAPGSGYSLARSTADVLEALSSLDIEQCHLAGHSWGGKVAMHFAAHHPHRVRSLILADPVPARGFNPMLRTFPGLIRAAFAPERLVFASESEMMAGRRTLVYLLADDAVDHRVWREKFVALPDGSYRPRLPESAFNALVNETFAEDISHLLPSIVCPVQLLLPLLTVSFWPGEVLRQSRSFAHATRHRVWGDHTFIHSNSLDTAKLMRAFLQDSARGCEMAPA
jgi:pimeloyl-ACP methyl ester carboxylesterase